MEESPAPVGNGRSLILTNLIGKYFAECTLATTVKVMCKELRQRFWSWNLHGFRKIAKSGDALRYIRLSVRPQEKLGSHLTDFHEILYFGIFRESVCKFQVSLKSDKNNGYNTHL